MLHNEAVPPKNSLHIFAITFVEYLHNYLLCKQTSGDLNKYFRVTLRCFKNCKQQRGLTSKEPSLESSATPMVLWRSTTKVSFLFWQGRYFWTLFPTTLQHPSELRCRGKLVFIQQIGRLVELVISSHRPLQRATASLWPATNREFLQVNVVTPQTLQSYGEVALQHGIAIP